MKKLPINLRVKPYYSNILMHIYTAYPYLMIFAYMKYLNWEETFWDNQYHYSFVDYNICTQHKYRSIITSPFIECTSIENKYISPNAEQLFLEYLNKGYYVYIYSESADIIIYGYKKSGFLTLSAGDIDKKALLHKEEISQMLATGFHALFFHIKYDNDESTFKDLQTECKNYLRSKTALNYSLANEKNCYGIKIYKQFEKHIHHTGVDEFMILLKNRYRALYDFNQFLYEYRYIPRSLYDEFMSLYKVVNGCTRSWLKNNDIKKLLNGIRKISAIEKKYINGLIGIKYRNKIPKINKHDMDRLY